MASGGRREAALSTLKESLVSRFGAASRDVVFEEVDRRLAGRRKLELEDIDAIERAVTEARRQKRGGAPGASRARRARGTDLTRSAPDLRAALRSDATAVATAAASPPAPSSSASGSRLQLAAAAPLSTAGSAAVAGASSKKGIIPPWGVGATLFDPEVKQGPFQGKHFVPLPPKVKPVDHFDVIAIYESRKAADMSDEFLKVKSMKDRTKALLESSVEDLEVTKAQERLALQKIRADINMLDERDKEKVRQEHEVEMQKRDKMIAANDLMREEIRQKEEAAHARKIRERDHMVSWLMKEKERREEERIRQAHEHATMCKTMRSQMLQAVEDEKARKKAEREFDKQICKAQEAQADERAERGREAVRQRVAVIEKNSKTIGAMIAERDARQARELEESLQKAQMKFEQEAREKAFQAELLRQEQVKGIISTLDEQMKERSERSLVEIEANAKQLAVFKKQLADFNEAEETKLRKAREARADLDVSLVGQMRRNATRHRLERGEPHLGEQLKNQDCALNRDVFERMLNEGFMPEMTESLAEARFKTKLDPHPSVAPFEGHISNLEMEVPTVG